MALFNVSNGRAQFDAAGNEPGDVYGAGVRLTQSGATRVTTTAGTDFNGGIPMSSTGQVSVVDATAGLPADTIYLNGLPISNNAVCVSRNAAAVVSNGLPFDSAGAVAGDINLDLNFVGATSLNSSVTFTRASTATYFDSTGTLQSAAIDAPRFDFNPSTLAAQGLLIEESRTNSIRNNTMQGAVAGTPGTLPTNWNVSGLGTLTQQVVGTGTVNGINYVDIRLSGTTSTTQVAIRFDFNNVIAAANGQTWAFSWWQSVVAGSTANLTPQAPSMLFYDAGAGFLGGIGFTAATFNSTSNFTRQSGSATIATANTAFIQPQINFLFASGAAIDITLRIGLPQLEQGAFATSVIPTTTTALTRAQDRAVVNTISPWYNSVAGTIYAEFSLTLPASGGNQFFTQTSDNSYNNRIVNNISSTAFPNTSTVSGGTSDGFASTAGAVTANTTVKVAAAYASNDLAISLNGGTVATDNTVTIPSGLTRFDLGSDHLGFNNVKAGYLRRITYYPTRLSNAQLQAITA